MKRVIITIRVEGDDLLYPFNRAEVQIPLEKFLHLLGDNKEAQKLLGDLYYKIDPSGYQFYIVYNPTKTCNIVPDISNPVKQEKIKSDKEQIMDEWSRIINESIV